MGSDRGRSVLGCISPVFSRNPLAPILDCKLELIEDGVLIHARFGRLRIARAALAAWAGMLLFLASIAEASGAWGESGPFSQLVTLSYLHILRPLLLSAAVFALIVLFSESESRLQRSRLVLQLKQVLSIESDIEIS